MPRRPLGSYILWTAVSLFLFSRVIYAQDFGLSLAQSLALSAEPQNPGPFEEVTLEVSTSAFDIKRAPIRWYKNGALTASGDGEKILKTRVGDAGSVSTFRVSVSSPKGDILERSITLRPQAIYLLWQADTSVPAWYRGKALPSPGAVTKVVALPKFIIGARRLAPSSLFYEWFINGVKQLDKSGKSRDVFSVTLPNNPAGSVAIKVKIEDKDSALTQEKEIILENRSPQVLLYRSIPLIGELHGKSLSNLSLAGGEEIQIMAEPYFFSVQDLQSLDFMWRIDGNAPESQGSPSSLLLKTKAESRGKHSISVLVENVKNIFQRATKSINVFIE